MRKKAQCVCFYYLTPSAEERVLVRRWMLHSVVVGERRRANLKNKMRPHRLLSFYRYFFFTVTSISC